MAGRTAAGQTYANHVHQPRAWSLTWLAGAMALLLTAWELFRQPSLPSLVLFLIAGTVVATVTLLRVFALRLQNRIIRLEMEVRLARIGRDGDVDRITLPQLIALRFASDGELPGLLDRAIDETLSPADIKKSIRQWRGDHLRT